MARKVSCTLLLTSVALLCHATAQAQFTKLVTDMENPSGNPWAAFVTEVMFVDPTVSGTTTGVDPAVNDDSFWTSLSAGDPFSVVHSGSGAVASTWGWEDASRHTSWVRLVTVGPDFLENPALHLQGKVRFWAAIKAYTDNTFGTQVTNGTIWLGIGVRETGEGVYQGGNGGNSGDVEWVGVDKLVEILGGTNGTCDTLADPNSDDIQLIDPNDPAGPDDVCVDAGPDGVMQTSAGDDDELMVTPRGGAGVPTDGVMRLYEIDLTTGVISRAGVPQGGTIASFSGDGILAATPNNRGTLDHLVLTNDPGNAALNANVILLNIDDVEFEAPILDPPQILKTPPPAPLEESVIIEIIDPDADLVELLRLNGDGSTTLIASADPAGDTEIEIATPPLASNLKLVARQTVGADTSDNSTAAIVVSPGNGPLRIAMAVRETDQYDHGLGCGADGTGFDADQPSKLEFIGSQAQEGFGVPTPPRFTPSLDWFEITFNPCDPDYGVTIFSGNGELDNGDLGVDPPVLNPAPDFTDGVWEGLYFRIDELSPTTGPFTIYIDDVVVKRSDGSVVCVVNDFEGYDPNQLIIEPADGNGTADTFAAAGDVQVVFPGMPTFPGQIVVSPGTDGVLDTVPAGDEVVDALHATFNNPGAAGTSVALASEPDQSAITDEESFSGMRSLKVEWAFLEASNLSSTLRLTTNGSTATDPPETMLDPDPVITLSEDGTLCDGELDLYYSVMIKIPPPIVPGDGDFDADVDLLDYAIMQQCVSLPPPPAGGCEVFNLAPNGAPDGVVDDLDFDLFGYLMIGPAQ